MKTMQIVTKKTRKNTASKLRTVKPNWVYRIDQNGSSEAELICYERNQKNILEFQIRYTYGSDRAKDRKI